MCCRALIVPIAPERLKDFKDADPYSFDYMKMWKPLTLDEAMKINPGHFSLLEIREYVEGRGHFIEGCHGYIYSCLALVDSPEGAICTVYDKRPLVCSDYPWYGRSPSPGFIFYSRTCGYKVDFKIYQNKGLLSKALKLRARKKSNGL